MKSLYIYLDGGQSALEMGDLIRDADYYRLTKSAAQERYAALKRTIGKN